MAGFATSSPKTYPCFQNWWLHCGWSDLVRSLDLCFQYLLQYYLVVPTPLKYLTPNVNFNIFIIQVLPRITSIFGVVKSWQTILPGCGTVFENGDNYLVRIDAGWWLFTTGRLLSRVSWRIRHLKGVRNRIPVHIHNQSTAGRALDRLFRPPLQSKLIPTGLRALLISRWFLDFLHWHRSSW